MSKAVIRSLTPANKQFLKAINFIPPPVNPRRDFSPSDFFCEVMERMNPGIYDNVESPLEDPSDAASWNNRKI